MVPSEPCYHGPAGYKRYIEGTNDVWGREVRRWSPVSSSTSSRVWFCLRTCPSRAQTSGIPLAESYAGVMTFPTTPRGAPQD